MKISDFRFATSQLTGEQSVSKTQLQQIREAEAAAEKLLQELLQQAAKMREQARNTADPAIREDMLEIAGNIESEARNLVEALRGMRQCIQ